MSYSYVDGNESFLALEDIDLEIADGEFVCLIGHSGCGKSTLLSLLAGLSMPTSGEILIDDVPVRTRARPVDRVSKLLFVPLADRP